MTRAWPWIRAGAAVGLLGLVGWRLGAGPFLEGVRSLSPGALAAAAVIGLVTTCCAATRWSTIADGMGVGLGFRAAVAAYYRAQFLNSVLPGGIVGDIDRGLRHGRAANAVGLGLRAMAWDRLAGQVVQIALTAAVLAATPGPARLLLPWMLAGAAGLAGIALILARTRRRAGRPARIARAVASDLRTGLLDRRRWPVVAATSILVVAGHTVTLVIAARSVGLEVPTGRILPIALVVLAAMSIPASIGGWGPREGAAAWVFAASGWGAGQGVATTTAYGVMALVATLPGLALLLVQLRRRRDPGASSMPDAREPVTGAAHV
jgi:uncharacterized membrane protein YbhN (UPF0104 family)